MVANFTFQDPRYNFVFCYTDTTIPLDSYVTINDTPARTSIVYTAQDGWDPGVTSSNQGVIGFNFDGSGFTFGDTFNITNGSYTLPVSGYSSAGYGYLNFTADRNYSGIYPGANIYAEQNYLNVGTGDFTIEFVVKLNTLEPYQTFVSFEGAGGFPASAIFSIVYQEGLKVYNTNFGAINLGGSFQTDTWYHIAIVRSFSNIYFYLDGELQNSQYWSYDYSNITTTRFGVIDVYGYAGLNNIFGLSGSMCNIRITTNEALYTSNFSPPTLSLTAGANTTVLMLAGSDANKYVNSIDNVVFTNVNNPTTNEPVTYSPGPIPYPPPLPVYNLYYTPTNGLFDWYEGPNKTGTPHYGETLLGFTTANVSAVQTFNFYTSLNTLTGVNNYPNLQTLILNNSNLTQLNVSNCISLSTVDIESTPITFLDFYNSTSLTGLTAYQCSLTSINLPSSAPNLNSINLSVNSLTALNVSSYSNLINLKCYNNQLYNITLGTLPNLTTLISSSNQVSTLDISGLSALRYIEHNGNQGFTQLTALDISNNNNLETISFYSNLLTYLNFSNCPNLYNVNISYNYFNDLDFSNKNSLYILNCAGNVSLSALNISNCTALSEIDCHNTGLSSIDISTNIHLNYLIAYSNYNFTTAVVDQLLNTLATNAVANSTQYGVADFSYCAPRSSASDAAVSTLANAPYYWSIYTT